MKISKDYVLTLSPELAKTLGSERRVLTDEEKNLENPPKIDTVEKIMVHCNLVRNEFDEFANLLFTFKPSGAYGRLLSPQIFYPIWKKTRNSSDREIRIWLTDQDGNPLQFEDNWSATILFKNEDKIYNA